MLLSGAERQDVAPLILGVDRLSDQTTHGSSQVGLPGSEDAQVGTAVGHRDPQRLAVSGNGVGTVFAWGAEPAERDGIGNRDA